MTDRIRNLLAAAAPLALLAGPLPAAGSEAVRILIEAPKTGE
jgi:hypothetical protein